MEKKHHVPELEELQELEEEERNRFFVTVRKIVLAGIGAVGLAQDEVENLIERLVERGEIAEKDARKLLREVSEKRGKTAERAWDKQIEAVLDRMNVPSKSDIEALSKKITHLAAKIDELKEKKAHV
jgi:polyhydroxyalkanoate synthesis regulator phasin